MSVKIQKVWTCKYPADSDLNERLREASKQANLPYYKLLAKMLDLWEQYQADNSSQVDVLNTFNARIKKSEKFIEKLLELLRNDIRLEWDSETENWIDTDKQQDKVAESPHIENMPEEQPVKDEPEADKQSEEDQSVIEFAEQDGVKPKPKSNKKQTRTK